MLRILFISLSLALTCLVSAQEAQYLDLIKSEALLEDLFNQLYADTLSDREQVLTSILDIMPEALSAEGALDFPWKGLTRIGVITSDDQMLRIFTWHVRHDPDQYRYFGFMQVGQKKGKFKLYSLVDNGLNQRGVAKLDQSAENWYGKLYYSIITNNYKRKTYYTLLGLDFNNTRSNIKTIETIALQRNQPRFTKELFFIGSDKQDRLVLEYSSQVAISVRFDPGLDMITFDHLVPFHPIYENNYEFYGPDGSFEGLQFEDGIWIQRRDIDARNIN